MRTSSVLFTAALASLAQHLVTLAAADRTPFSSVKSTLGQGATANTVPNAYIVELAAPVAGLKRGLGELSVHEDLYKRLAERNVAYSVRKEFSSDIFTGVSITLASSHPNAIDAVSSIPGIKSFQPVSSNFPFLSHNFASDILFLVPGESPVENSLLTKM